jgi:hypothetical protein
MQNQFPKGESIMKTLPYQSVLRTKGIFIPIVVALSVVHYLQKSMHAGSRSAIALELSATARRSRAAPKLFDAPVSAAGRNQLGSRPVSRYQALHGTLVISCGGDAPPAVNSEFLAVAGGAHARLVVVPTASELAGTPELEEDLEDWRKQNVVSCTVLHTTLRDVANDPDFCRPLESATGVWFMGGSQSKLVDIYLNTRFLSMVKAVLERDGVVGGESAGAAIMSPLMICGGYESPRTGRGL